MRDGTVLRSDVWRPRSEGTYPSLLLRTPYAKEAVTSNDLLRIDQAAAAGYAVVVQDVRGRFSSDGVWHGLSRESWEVEGTDTYDTVEWVAAQDWCDGGVGMWGLSYLACVQWLGAAEQPPHLKAIAPAMMGDQVHDHLDFGGAFRLATYFMYPFFMAAMELPKLIESGEASAEDAEQLMELLRDPDIVLDHLPLAECPYFDLPGVSLTTEQLLSREYGAPTEFAIGAVSVPALVVGGWFDLYPAQTIEQFQRLRSESGGGDGVRSAHRLLVGPWAHGPLNPWQGESHFGLDAAGAVHAHAAHIAFFDRHLRGKDVDLPPVRYFLMGANQWRSTDAWPPPDAHLEAWYLHSNVLETPAEGRTLSLEHPGEESPDSYMYDPADPVRSHGGRVMFPGVPGPLDQSRLGARSDVLCYTSEPFDEPMDIVGPVIFRLFAASSARDTDFVAKLIDVHPDGRAILACSGLIRARYRKGPEQEVFLDPGEVEEYKISLTHTALRVLPEHRIQVQICSSDFPNLDRNMNTGNAIGVDGAPVVAEQTVFHDSRRPSRLELFVQRN